MAVRLDRIERDMEAFSKIGSTGGTSITRLALTAEDHAARRHFIGLCRAEGLEVRIDRFGNIAGVLGSWDQPALLMGSHLDSVPSGGRFDGTAGVAGALEAIRALREDGAQLSFPVGVICFTAEESSRWGIATLGSKGLAGIMTPQELASLTDASGITFEAACLENSGYELTEGPGEMGPIAGYFELHVEQGPHLERAGLGLGVVSRIAAPTRFKVVVKGEAAHSGSALMGLRKDGLTASAELILGLEELAEAEAEFTVATATVFALYSVSINVVPGQVDLGVDIRSVDTASKRRTVERFLRLARRVQALRGIEIEIITLADEEPVELNPMAVETLARACRSLNLPFLPMFSRAGHDAMNINRLAPAAMVFVPSRGGISHNPAEFTSPEDIAQGARVLVEAAKNFQAPEVVSC